MAKAPGNQTRNRILRGSTALLTLALAAAVTVTSFTGPDPIVRSAQAQDVSLTVQFRTALEPHGRWTRHNRWGEVWIPAKRDRDWRPYTEGRWVFTDEWGWYWASDEDFGWVTYHYGRWVLDPQFGWVWVPGNEWAPAWVQWRRGDRYAGWAPLPPQQVIYDYDDSPDYWIFVSFNNFTARNVRRVIVPQRERVVIIRQTVIVNRTIIVDGDRDRRARFAVNPGIEPRIVAARAGRPILVSNVKPVVVAGTVGVSSAVELRAEEARKQRNRTRVQITETKERVEPVKDVPPPQALKKGEEGRLGDRPPRAAKEQAQQQQQRQPDGAKGSEPATTKAAPEDAAKAKTEDSAKSKTDDSAKSRATEDAAKAKTEDAAKSKAADDAAKAKTDAAKSKADDDAKGARTKAPEPKGAPATQAKDADKGKTPEPKQAAPKADPKSAPESKQAAPKAEPKSAPEPKQAAPKAEPRSAPEPKQAAPKAEPKQAPAPQAAPKAEPKAAPAPQAAPKAAPAPAPQAAPKAAPAPAPQAAPKAAPPAAPAPKAAPAAKGKGEEKEKQ